MSLDRIQALTILAESGRLLRDQWRLDWPESVQQAIGRLRLDAQTQDLPPLVAIVGGASSGKSTVFNNLLGGHLVSRIAARGHTTLGPVLAVHERQRSRVEPLLAGGWLLPGGRVVEISPGDDTTGEADGLAVTYHAHDPLRNVLLIDTPDFTSDASAKEGHRTLSLLPWFDAVLVVVDHERWFDRQAISEFRPQSVRFGQRRLVLFNRTREGKLEERDRDALMQQARLLTLNAAPKSPAETMLGDGVACQRVPASDEMVVLEFCRGRGFCRFPPGALDGVVHFLRDVPSRRGAHLSSYAAEAAGHVLNQNNERRDRLEMLQSSLEAAAARLLPSVHECMISLMTPDERRRFAPVARVLRIPQTKEWLARRTLRITQSLKRLPILGTFVPASLVNGHAPPEANMDRRAIAKAHYLDIANRRHHEIRRLVRTSAFWHEVPEPRASARAMPFAPDQQALARAMHQVPEPQASACAISQAPLPPSDFAIPQPPKPAAHIDASAGTVRTERHPPSGPRVPAEPEGPLGNQLDRLDSEVARLDTAIKHWAAKVETELHGLNPHVTGAIGAGALVLAVVLIAVPGPVSALTLVAAKGAIGGALTQLAAATGVGAVFGRQFSAFAGVLYEKLLGSTEFDEVRCAAASYRTLIESDGRRAVDVAVREASRLVLAAQEPLAAALEHLHLAGDPSK